MIKLISFDLDGTFWDIEPTLRLAEKKLSEHLSKFDQLKDPINECQRLRSKLLKEEPDLQDQVSQLRLRTLEALFRDAGYLRPELLATEAFEHFYYYRQRVTLFPDVVPTLTMLMEKYHLMILTNGNADPNMIGIDRFFNYHLSADKLGVAKPDQKIFAAAETLTGYRGKEVVHVGDHLDDDIAGAAEAGWHCIWFNPQAEQTSIQPPIQASGREQAVAEIRRIGDLPKIIAAL